MPEKKTIQRARKDKREGKSASTQAGEFVKEEMHHIREANMARGLPSKPLRLAYRRLDGPE